MNKPLLPFPGLTSLPNQVFDAHSIVISGREVEGISPGQIAVGGTRSEDGSISVTHLVIALAGETMCVNLDAATASRVAAAIDQAGRQLAGIKNNG